jgi:hypothetical protein
LVIAIINQQKLIKVALVGCTLCTNCKNTLKFASSLYGWGEPEKAPQKIRERNWEGPFGELTG